MRQKADFRENSIRVRRFKCTPGYTISNPDLMMYIRKRWKESRVLDTLKRKHELKIVKVCVACGNAITISQLLRFSQFGFQLFQPDFVADVYR